jgi:hypothetical protein
VDATYRITELQLVSSPRGGAVAVLGEVADERSEEVGGGPLPASEGNHGDRHGSRRAEGRWISDGATRNPRPDKPERLEKLEKRWKSGVRCLTSEV